MMKHIITTTVSAVALAAALVSVNASAKTEYHVYMKNGSCEIDMRTPEEWKKARGSGWSYVGKDTTRSGAKKQAKKVGC